MCEKSSLTLVIKHFWLQGFVECVGVCLSCRVYVHVLPADSFTSMPHLVFVSVCARTYMSVYDILITWFTKQHLNLSCAFFFSLFFFFPLPLSRHDGGTHTHSTAPRVCLRCTTSLPHTYTHTDACYGKNQRPPSQESGG